jgi:hypothetical protein
MRVGNHRPQIHYAPRGVDIPSYIRQLGGAMMDVEGGPPDLILAFLPRKPIDAYVNPFPSLLSRTDILTTRLSSLIPLIVATANSSVSAM